MKTRLFFLFLIFFLISVSVYAERSVTVKPKEKRDLSVEAKKGLDPVLLNAKYHAIIIGNNNYKNLPKLKTAIADAKSVDELLKNQYGFETKLLLDATRNEILTTVNDFRKRLGSKDNLLIYYAGHGEFDKTADRAYWLPVNAQRDDPVDWISATDITDNIKRIASAHILIISDSCYSGTLTRAAAGDLSTKGERDEFVKKMMERKSRTLMASGGNEPVADEGGSGHSVFADSLLRALKEADKNIFTAEELFHSRVKSSVAGKSDQVPEYNDIKNSGHDGGDFVFRVAKLTDVESVSVPVGIPDVKIKEAPKTDFSLEDLDKKAKQIEDNRDAWSNTLKKMQDAFNKVSQYQKRDIEKDLKVAAWNKFLDSFPEKNPYSDDDETMRRKARQEMERWQKVAMAPVVGDTRDTVTGMELIFVKGGCYQMGDTFGDGGGDEKPMHEVCVDDFYMGKYEVTNEQFRKFRPDHNSNDYSGFSLNNDNQPVVYVSYEDAVAYAEWLSQKTGKKYRLPTEAEWEYAARGGTRSRNYWGDNKDDACKYANVHDRTSKSAFKDWTWENHNCDDGYKVTAPVGRFQPNAFGLYDMMGNVWEWVADWYDENYYRNSPKNNPKGASSGQYRVLRGGSWFYRPMNLRTAGRIRFVPTIRDFSVGFRLASPAQ